MLKLLIKVQFNVGAGEAFTVDANQWKMEDGCLFIFFSPKKYTCFPLTSIKHYTVEEKD